MMMVLQGKNLRILFRYEFRKKWSDRKNHVFQNLNERVVLPMRLDTEKEKEKSAIVVLQIKKQITTSTTQKGEFKLVGAIQKNLAPLSENLLSKSTQAEVAMPKDSVVQFWRHHRNIRWDLICIQSQLCANAWVAKITHL